MSILLSFICLLMLFLGLAATLGVLMRTSIKNGRITRFIFLTFVILPFALALPWNLAFKAVASLLAVVVILAFYRMPLNPISLRWQKIFALIYFCLLMILVAGWSLFYQGQSILWLTALALLAGAACVIRILHPRAI